jgi:hypothetical protein
LESAPSFERYKWPDMDRGWVSLVESFWPTHAAILVSVEDQWLTMTYVGGFGEHRHAVASNATITRNGQVALLSELREGDRLHVTVEEEAGIRVVTKIEAESPAGPEARQAEKP